MAAERIPAVYDIRNLVVLTLRILHLSKTGVLRSYVRVSARRDVPAAGRSCTTSLGGQSAKDKAK